MPKKKLKSTSLKKDVPQKLTTSTSRKRKLKKTEGSEVSSPAKQHCSSRTRPGNEANTKEPPVKAAERGVLTTPPIKLHRSHRTEPGQVMVMGQGEMGQLGLGEEVMERKRPFPVGGALEGHRIVQVACGGMHTAALTDSGTVFTWGCNDEGALGREMVGGEDFLPGRVQGELDEKKVVQLSAGDSHTAALLHNGDVYCWGVFRDSGGPFGLIKDNLPSTSPTLVVTGTGIKIVSGADHLIILTNSRDILTMGCAEQGQLGRVPEIFSSRGGRRGVRFLLKASKVRFGKPKHGPRPKFIDVYCGTYHTFGLTEDKVLYVWGLNNYGQAGTGDTKDRYQPERLPENWAEKGEEGLEIAGGMHHTLLCSRGSVYVMGRKEYGRLGLGQDLTEPLVPQKLPKLTGIIAVAAGPACSYALGRVGEVYSWGMGTSLQLGTGSDSDSWMPAKVSGKQLEGRKVLGISLGGQHAALLDVTKVIVIFKLEEKNGFVLNADNVLVVLESDHFGLSDESSDDQGERMFAPLGTTYSRPGGASSSEPEILHEHPLLGLDKALSLDLQTLQIQLY